MSVVRRQHKYQSHIIFIILSIPFLFVCGCSYRFHKYEMSQKHCVLDWDSGSIECSYKNLDSSKRETILTIFSKCERYKPWKPVPNWEQLLLTCGTDTMKISYTEKGIEPAMILVQMQRRRRYYKYPLDEPCLNIILNGQCLREKPYFEKLQETLEVQFEEKQPK